MKTKSLIFAFILMLAGSLQVTAQGFKPPAEGKAVIYFVRVTSWGGNVSFEFFHNDKLIGISKGKNYIRYECDPGKSLFWASSENKEFLPVNLEAGKTYIVLINVIMGGWKARVGLEPLTPDNEDFERAVDLIKSKPPAVTSQKTLDKSTKKLKERGFIKENLNKYETVWKDSGNFREITPDMYIPEDLLK